MITNEICPRGHQLTIIGEAYSMVVGNSELVAFCVKCDCRYQTYKGEWNLIVEPNNDNTPIDIPPYIPTDTTTPPVAAESERE